MRGIWLLVFSLLAQPAVYANDARKVRKTVEGFVNPALAVLKDKALDKETRKKKVADIVTSVFDFALIAKLTLGRAHWSKFDKAQQKEFTDLFVKSLQDSYADKMDLLTDEKVEFNDPEPAEKGKFEMLTFILSKGDRHKMLYRLYKQESDWKVYDVEISGISLVKSYGAQYDQFLQNGTPAGLIKKLKEKALEPPPELASQDKVVKSTNTAQAPPTAPAQGKP